MNTRHLVDPELLPLLEMFVPGEVTAQTLPAVRQLGREGFRAMGEPVLPATVAHTPAREGAPPVPLRIFSPSGAADAPRAAVLHMHGGGFVAGFAEMNDAQNAALAERHNIVVVSVDYRLAPETPFPGPVEDCLAAYRWLLDNADTLGVDPERIVVKGESAGGGLAAALTLLARDEGLPPFAGQVLIYPMIDHRTGSARDANPVAGEFVWSRGSNAFGWASMRGHDPIPTERIGHFSPSHAADVSRLPPAFIAVGALDLFVDEDLDYALALMRAGVPVDAAVYSGAFHGFDLLAGSRLALRMEEDVAAAIDRMTDARTR